MATRDGNTRVQRGGTGKFIAQGQTSGPYGNDPMEDARGEAGRPARDLKP